MGFSYSDPEQNPNPLAIPNTTGKNESLVFINILFIYINLIKPWHKKKTIWLTGA